MSQSWTIGILCYNEEQSITGVIEDALNVLKLISDDNELLIIDDGSTDNTLSIINTIANQNDNIKVLKHTKNLGIGEAILTIHQNANKENLCVISGDGETKVKELIPFSNIEKNTFISFYRKENTTYNFKRNVYSYLNKIINKYLVGINLKDVNWTKIYKTEEVKYLDLKLKSSLVESEICFKLLNTNHKVIEIESEYLQRTGGVSKGDSKSILYKAISEVIKLIWVSIKFRLFNN